MLAKELIEYIYISSIEYPIVQFRIKTLNTLRFIDKYKIFMNSIILIRTCKFYDGSQDELLFKTSEKIYKEVIDLCKKYPHMKIIVKSEKDNIIYKKPKCIFERHEIKFYEDNNN